MANNPTINRPTQSTSNVSQAAIQNNATDTAFAMRSFLTDTSGPADRLMAMQYFGSTDEAKEALAKLGSTLESPQNQS